ncbi:rRNA maturation RNase YbeY [Candidatus Purcelliella pentastirinorum]|uniref:Endoribonuclease YbeY n=1 Tax=Candidatus Purcelliella pentastirinorum TaxID=472834 RepID=A0AAX3N9P8_9ENTR|nr:rRNA maturation RNase YbeY [Candidatus Purcelliella pentastirinorum]WDI78719.1 rRNA maturation RNase YbeY [Candidatus Purcelliella pentastirinorum]WDR80670.1 rRNA maturation RNase YbeY [Candidatus Purcelliella pentastirinorum]
MNKIILNIKFYIDYPSWFPCKNILRFWFNTIFEKYSKRIIKITLCIVNKSISRKLNKIWRNKNNPTNVLTFPFIIPTFKVLPIYSDIIVCSELIKNESLLLKQSVKNYWAYIIVHSSLHLMGYNHSNFKLENKMKKAEKYFLNLLNL